MAADLRALPEIEVLAAVRDGQVLYDDENRTLLGGPTAVLSDLVNFTLLDGEISDIAGNRIGMRSGLAEGLSIGDEVTIEFARTGAQRFQLAAIFDARGIGAGLLVDSSTFAANFTEQFDSQVFIDLADGITLVEGRTAVEAVTARYVGSQVLDQEELASEAGSRIDELVRLVFGLLGVAVVIALIGITNTLTLSVLERRREIGLLRAVGLSRRQLRTAIGWEAVLIALLGALLGLGLGLIFAWAVITALDDEVLRLSVPWVRVGLSLIAAALAGLIAAAVPAWRASRRNILEAISYE
jgi:putative ABC transport system permease protein